jgi:hypothetical protein
MCDGRDISSMDIPSAEPINVTLKSANSVHGASGAPPQIFADKLLWSIH